MKYVTDTYHSRMPADTSYSSSRRTSALSSSQLTRQFLIEDVSGRQGVERACRTQMSRGMQSVMLNALIIALRLPLKMGTYGISAWKRRMKYE